MAGCGWKSQPQAAKNPSSATTKNETVNPSKPWDDWLIIQGNNYIPVVDELGRNIQRARQEFLETNFQAAAAEVRKGADFLKQEMGPASPSEKAKLSAAIKEMEELADSLDKNSVTSLEALDRVFAKAHQADMENSWAVVGLERWFPFVESTGQHLNNAREAYLKRDFRTAATEIRKAEALLKLQANRGSTEGRGDLEAARNALEALATKIEMGSVLQSQVLSNTFAAAQYALARVHEQLALQQWADKDRVNTGFELKAAILHLEKGDSWAGHEREPGFVKNSLKLSEELIEGRAVAGKSVDRGIENIGRVIENHDRKIELALK
jgi:hypothetical protein